jgi:acetyl-CoA carboxylase biotin carboxyl carrier protein
MPEKKTARTAAAKSVAPAGKDARPSELDLVRSLAGILNETGLTEIQLNKDGVKIRVSKSVTVAASVAPSVSTPISTAAAAVAVSDANAAPDNDHAGTVKSPMVGTVYLAPAPASPNFVEAGQEVKQGQTLLIIEAMKTMNQIPAPRSGKVTRILVASGDPVEYGSPLAVIE